MYYYKYCYVYCFRWDITLDQNKNTRPLKIQVCSWNIIFMNVYNACILILFNFIYFQPWSTHSHIHYTNSTLFFYLRLHKTPTIAVLLSPCLSLASVFVTAGCQLGSLPATITKIIKQDGPLSHHCKQRP